MENDITKAYLQGLKLKQQGLSEDIIYARLEKQGFGEELSRKVAKEVINQNEKLLVQETRNYGLMIAIFGVVASVASFFLFDDRVYLFAGLLITGIICLVLGKKRRVNK
jgi:hypothetical protein